MLKMSPVITTRGLACQLALNHPFIHESLPTGHVSSQAQPYITTLYPAVMWVSCTNGNKNVNNTPQVETVWSEGGQTASDLFLQIHSLLKYSDKDYATCPSNLHSLSDTHSDDHPACLMYSKQSVGCPGDVNRGSNQRQIGVRERVNKVTVVFIHHALQETDEDLPVLFALQDFHWTIWQFTPQGRLNHLILRSTPILFSFLNCISSLLHFQSDTPQISLDTAGKEEDGQRDKERLHKAGE